MDGIGLGEGVLSALDAMGTYVVLLDAEGRVLHLSRACREVSGYGAGEAQGKPYWELYSDPEDARAARASFEALRSQGGVRKRLSHCPGPGETRLIQWTETPILAADGSLRQVLSLGTDVTEAAQQAVSESERRYRTIFETAGTAMAILEADMTITRVNERFVELAGYPREEIEGKKRWTEFAAPADRERMIEYHRLRRTHPAAAPRRYEACFLRRDGEGRAVLVTVDMIPDSDRSVASFLDITEPRRAAAALRRSEERYRALVESMVDWVWEVDENVVYTYASPRVRELLGYEPEEVVGKTPFDFMAPEEAERVRALFAPIAARREPFTLLENTLVHRDGHTLISETSGSPIFDEAGVFRGYRGVDRDITERKRAVDALKAADERLLEVEREKKGFYRDVIRAVTEGKLLLVDAPEIPEVGEHALSLELGERASYGRLRGELRDLATEAGMPAERAADLVLAAAEAAANAIKHAGGGMADIHLTEERVIVRITDRGPGIQTGALPSTILIPGYSTGVSLGMGYTLMLRLADTIWLATGPEGTVVQLAKRIHPEEDNALELLTAWEHL